MSNASPITVFDRGLLRQRLQRVWPRRQQHDVVFKETALMLATRLQDVKRPFHTVLNLSLHDKAVVPVSDERQIITANFLGQGESLRVAVDEEILPFAAQSFDLVVSNLTLHLVNDLPGTLAQIRQVLKPDGMFIAALLGGDSLIELRDCLMEAEMTLTGGVSPRVHPVIDLPMASALMQRAGFALPVADAEFLTLTYPNLFALMRDIRGMGWGNLHVERLRHPTRRSLFALAENLYRQRYGSSDGKWPLTFEVIFLHGWAS